MAELRPDIPLVCIAIAHLPIPPVKTRRAQCSLCGEPVWVALSSPEQPVLWCWDCAGDELAKHERVKAVMTDDQLADVIAHFDWGKGDA